MANNERSLQGLPTELQFQIMNDLDYKSILALQQTSKYFNDLSYHCDNQRKTDLIFGAEMFDRHNKNLHAKSFGCYTCFRVLPKSNFGKRRIRGKRGKDGSEATSRFCVECARKHHLCSPGSMVNTESVLRLKCAICEEWQTTKFCRRCRKCEACLSRWCFYKFCCTACGYQKGQSWELARPDRVFR